MIKLLKVTKPKFGLDTRILTLYVYVYKIPPVVLFKRKKWTYIIRIHTGQAGLLAFG